MKKSFLLLVFIAIVSITARAQHAEPQLLKEPAGWEFERFTLPPGFAPAIHYKGVEELRFAPGMFNKDSAAYFTYVFIAQLDDVPAVSQNDIRTYLLEYYKGLCSTVAQEGKRIIDTTQITATVEKQAITTEIIYNASLNIFGVFADAAPVKLNMEIKVLTSPADKKTYLIFLASPRGKTDAIWKKLYEIRKGITIAQ